jgi:hypothetical protein
MQRQSANLQPLRWQQIHVQQEKKTHFQEKIIHAYSKQ